MVIEITDSNFDKEVLQFNGAVLVDVFATWCGPCKIMGPMIDEIAREYKDRIKVGKLDVDKSPNIPGRYNILSVPTLLFFKNGQLVDQQVGLVSKQVLQKKIENLYQV